MPEWEDGFERGYVMPIAREVAVEQLAEADSTGGRGAAEAALERHRILRNELRPRERIFWDGKPYRDAVCELWDALQDVLAAHRAA